MFETEAGCSDKDSNAESDDSGTSENLSFVVDDSKSLTVYDSDEYFKDTDDDISNNSKLVTPVAVKKGPGRPKKNNGNQNNYFENNQRRYNVIKNRNFLFL